jgi:hypothetical protein
MKKINLLIFIALLMIISVIFYACKDEFTEKDAMNLQNQFTKEQKSFDDSLNTKKVRVMYSVNLVDASKSTLKSGSLASSVSGAIVKLTQDGRVITKKCDTTNIAVFDSLKTGYATVNISLTNFSEVNYVVNFSSQVGSGLSGGIQLANIIPLIPIAGTSTASISGRITFEGDLTNNTPEPVPTGTKIIAIVKTNSAALVSPSGIIMTISYDNLSLETTTDANGNYTLSVPATTLGLDYDLRVIDFTYTQNLLMPTYNNRDTFGVVAVPTFFGSSITSGASTVTAVNPVYVTLGAPNYSYTQAVASVVVDNSNGIDNIQITNNGGFYAPRNNYRITVNDPTNTYTVDAVAAFSVNNFGRVTEIEITSTGSDYPSGADNYAFTIPYSREDAIVTVSSVNGSGGITGVSVTSGGRYYINDPEVVSFSNNNTGSGARMVASFSWNASGYYYVSGVTVDGVNIGTNYVVNGTFSVKINASLINNPMTGVLHMTKGSVSAINISNQGANYIDGKVEVVIDGPGNGGSTAKAIAVISDGKIVALNITDAGSGYIIAPTITIFNKVGSAQARASATVSAKGQITALTMSVNGDGYATPPTVTITPSVSGRGSGASAIANISGGSVTSLTLINGGDGYTGTNAPSSAQNASTVSANVKGASSTIVNINLGTGKRSIEQ